MQKRMLNFSLSNYGEEKEIINILFPKMNT